MTDAAITAINGRPTNKLTFDWFRQAFKQDHGQKDALRYGHAVLDGVPLLDQYLYTYGPMIQSQWEQVADKLDSIAPPQRLIDYGCGQGLAGLTINDVTDGNLLSEVTEVVLIEPSELALARAAAIYAKLCPDATVTTINKRFDDVADEDIPEAADGHTLHLFSNSLDVLGYDPLRLLAKTVQAGANTFISVSADRDFDGGTPRIKEVKAAIEHPGMADQLTVTRREMEEFSCTTGSRPKGIVWLCELDVHDS